jgi:hypothetical protein
MSLERTTMPGGATIDTTPAKTGAEGA